MVLNAWRYPLQLCMVFMAAFLSGCSNTVVIESLEPAKVDRAAKTKVIAVIPFMHDSTGLSEKLEALLANKVVKGKPFFTVVVRRNLEHLLEEHRLQYSGLVDEATTIEIGRLTGAQGLISGEVNTQTIAYRSYLETRSECADENCKKLREFYVDCTQMTGYLAATMRMVGVSEGEIIYADNFVAELQYDHCIDESGGLPPSGLVLDRLSHSVAGQFVRQVSPNPVSFEVSLLDEPELDYADDQEARLEYGLEHLKNGRLDKADLLLSELLSSTADRCYVAAYDLGLVKELKGQYMQAQSLYRLADRLTIKPIEEIDDAVLRIQKVISNQTLIQRQL